MKKHIKKRKPLKRIYVSINMEETGQCIRNYVEKSGYTVREIMEITGVTTEQAIYKWYRGKSLPLPETLLALSLLFGVHMEDLLVLEGIPEEGDSLSPVQEPRVAEKPAARVLAPSEEPHRPKARNLFEVSYAIWDRELGYTFDIEIYDARRENLSVSERLIKYSKFLASA